MPYTVRFRDKSNAGVSDKDGESLGLMLMQMRKPDYVTINGNTVRTSEILGVTKNKLTAADYPPSRTLSAGPKCRAQYSIALETLKIARDVSGRAGVDNPNGLRWPQLVKDRAWKEQIRKKLRSTSLQWCDGQTNECACEADFKPDPERLDVIRDIFFPKAKTEKGKVPVKVNSDGTEEMPEDFLTV
jgi:hypothetical protein